MSKMINIINYLLRKAIESTNWEETEDEISATLIDQGFNGDEVTMALAIASRIRNRLTSSQPIVIPKPSNQLFRWMEMWKLSPEAQGYLIALREQGHITEMERQAVIDAAIQTDVSEVDLEIIQELTSQVCGYVASQGEAFSGYTIH